VVHELLGLARGGRRWSRCRRCLDPEAGDRLAGGGDAVDDLLRPAGSMPMTTQAATFGSRRADHGAEVQVEIGAELQAP